MSEEVTDNIEGFQTEDNRVKDGRGQGSMREDRSSQLNPIASNFHPRDHEPPRSQDSRLSAETTDGSPPNLNH